MKISRGLHAYVASSPGRGGGEDDIHWIGDRMGPVPSVNALEFTKISGRPARSLVTKPTELKGYE